jgi:hypothetical protein
MEWITFSKSGRRTDGHLNDHTLDEDITLNLIYIEDVEETAAGR